MNLVVKSNSFSKYVIENIDSFERTAFFSEKKVTWNDYYEGESNENRKTEIKIRNIAPLSYKLADMLPML
jgi:hypothetical protein